MIKIWIKQGRCPNLADTPNFPDFTLHVVNTMSKRNEPRHEISNNVAFWHE